MSAVALTTPTATPNQLVSSIVFTTGSKIRIKTPAAKVFTAITDTASWSTWNSWTTSLTFPEGQSIFTPGSKGTLHTRMEAQQRDYAIPIEILGASRPANDVSGHNSDGTSSDSFVIAWKSLLMPSWFATAERVQIISPILLEHDDGSKEEICELRQWESMAGWGAYLLKWMLGVDKQLVEANVRYAEELARFIEGSY